MSISNERPSTISSSVITGHILSKDTVLIWSSEDAITLRRDHRIVGAFIGGLPTRPRQATHYGLPLKLLPEETTLLLEKGLLQLTVYKSKEDTPCLSPPPVKREKIEEEEDEKEKERKDNEQDLSSTVYIYTSDQISTDDIGDIESRITNSSNLWKWPVTSEQVLKYRVFSDLWHKGYYITPGLKYGGDYLVYSSDPAIVHSHFIAKIVSWEEPILPLSLVQDGRLGGKVKKNTLLCTVDPSSDNSLQYMTLKWTGIA